MAPQHGVWLLELRDSDRSPLAGLLIIGLSATRGLAPTALFDRPLRGRATVRAGEPEALPFLDFLGKVTSFPDRFPSAAKR